MPYKKTGGKPGRPPGKSARALLEKLQIDASIHLLRLNAGLRGKPISIDEARAELAKKLGVVGSGIEKKHKRLLSDEAKLAKEAEGHFLTGDSPGSRQVRKGKPKISGNKP
ncbi:hypothetical protein GCM10011521_12200 [Arenimonas soli]|uniref:Uncharacterized protein n=1 Tax=Arenimonas soli TaxID=2269504 RepID=A0ABQ1HGZ1_9GAMM|nr:hypothetical protein [Arenimonas soli]GGA75591.1 hypothetical protein GCM10011521_12200 [Arenimonas soli]